MVPAASFVVCDGVEAVDEPAAAEVPDEAVLVVEEESSGEVEIVVSLSLADEVEIVVSLSLADEVVMAPPEDAY